MLLKEYGYLIKDNVFFQDNKSDILMDKNGGNSCTGIYRNINVRYVFVKYRMGKAKARVRYCTTHLMLVDYFTNSLMGKMFKDLLGVLMRYKLFLEIDPKILSSIKEHVGNHLKSSD